MNRSILIVDDEPLILNGLSKRVDWAQLGCYVVGTADNGVDGYALVHKLEPDIVITDIVMPGKTGLDIARLCHEKRNHTKVIILSAYEDFSYAKQAIAYGVSDYVLKPIEPDKLREAVRKAMDALEEQEKMERLQSQMRSMSPIVSASMLFSIARYGVEAVMVENPLMEALTLSNTGVVLCLKAYNVPQAIENPSLQLQRRVFAAFDGPPVTLVRGSAEGKSVFLLMLENGEDAAACRKQIVAKVAKLLEGVQRESQMVCVAVVSGLYHTPTELHEQYQEWSARLVQGFFSRGGILQARGQSAPGVQEGDLRGLMGSLASGKTEAALQAFDGLCHELLVEEDVAQAIHALREIHRQATQIASRAGMVHKPSMDSGCAEENFFLRQTMLRRYLEEIGRYIQTGENMLGRLQLLVEENYMHSHFGLSEAAELLSMSSSYLSRLFKKEMGRNFQEYLVDVRIGHAKELLENKRLKNSDIARQVGFEDDHYFGQVFKRKCGVTPKQYREELKK